MAEVLLPLHALWEYVRLILEPLIYRLALHLLLLEQADLLLQVPILLLTLQILQILLNY